MHIDLKVKKIFNKNQILYPTTIFTGSGQKKHYVHARKNQKSDEQIVKERNQAKEGYINVLIGLHQSYIISSLENQCHRTIKEMTAPYGGFTLV